MALIHCPECNKEISDKVKACPFCGYPFEAGADTKGELQQVEIASVNIASKDPARTKKILAGVIATIVILAISVAIFGIIKSNNEKKTFNAYIDNLNLAKETMIEGGSDAESLLNLIAQVWYNSIWEISDPDTNKYAKSEGRGFNDDFNTSLMALMFDATTQYTISTIENNQVLVETIMKDLQNPPDDLDKCYDTVTELYSIYKSLTNLAVNPSGSLQSFTESKTQKIDKFLELYQKLGTQIPEKK